MNNLDDLKKTLNRLHVPYTERKYSIQTSITISEIAVFKFYTATGKLYEVDRDPIQCLCPSPLKISSPKEEK